MGMDKILQKKKWYSKKQTWYSIGGISVFVLLYVVFLANSTTNQSVKLENIAICEVTNGEFQDYITNLGKVEPIRTIYLDVEEAGRVEELFVDDGATVTKGQEILRLSNTDLNLSIMNSEASLAEQTSRMRDTRLAMEQQSFSVKRQIIDLKYRIQKQKRVQEQNKKLYEKEYISQEEFITAQEDLAKMQEEYEILLEQQAMDIKSRDIQLNQLDESLAMMHTNLKMVRQKLDKLVVKAPVDGQLVTLDAEIGETMSRGQRLGVINILTSYKVNLDIDEHYIDKVRQGQQATIERGGIQYKLEISKVYPAVKNGFFSVDLKFVSEVPDNIRIGQSYHIRLELGAPGNSLKIKRGGFYQATGGQWIFVLSSDGKTAYKRDIKIGSQNPEYYQILEGLEEGEKVIISSYTTISEVETVTIEQ